MPPSDSTPKRTVLSLCDKSGVMVKPWVAAGYRAICVDIQHPPGSTEKDGITFIGADILFWRPPANERFAFVAAFPPCTIFASSGARWWKAKGIVPLIEGLRLVEACRAIAEGANCPWVLENPVGRLARCWRKQDYEFDPCDFGGYTDPPGGDAYAKRTWLWAGGGFKFPPTLRVTPERASPHGSWLHNVTAKGRGDARSVTPEGFARAVFLANHLP